MKWLVSYWPGFRGCRKNREEEIGDWEMKRFTSISQSPISDRNYLFRLASRVIGAERKLYRGVRVSQDSTPKPHSSTLAPERKRRCTPLLHLATQNATHSDFEHAVIGGISCWTITVGKSRLPSGTSPQDPAAGELEPDEGRALEQALASPGEAGS